MTPAIPRSRRRLRALAAAVVLLAATALAACGSDDEPQQGAAARPATLVPADAAVYAEALVRPHGEVEEGVRAASRRALRIDDPGRELRRALDEAGDGDYGYYSDHVDPWLGDTVAAFVLDEGGDEPDFGVLLSVRDRDAAEDMLAQMRRDGESRRGGEVDGVAYDRGPDGMVVALLDDYAVLAPLEGLRAAVAVANDDAPALADADGYAEASDALPASPLAWAYLEPNALVDLIVSASDAGPEETEQAADVLEELIGDSGPATVALAADADEIVLEASSDGADLAPDADDAGAVSIGDLPAGAWLALATPPLGAPILRSLERSGELAIVREQVRAAVGLDIDADLLGWLGGVAAFVRGTGPLDLDGALLLGSSDADASQRLVRRLGALAARMGVRTARTTGDGVGFQARVPDLPMPLVVLAEGAEVAVALGLDAARDALDPSESFAESAPGRDALDALGEGFEPSFVLVFDPLLGLLRTVGADDDPDVAEAMPYLSAYRSLAAGTKEDDGRTVTRVVLALREPDPGS